MIYDTLNNLPNYLGLCSSLDSVIEFSDTKTKEILVPRTDVVGFDVDCTRDQVLRTIAEHQYSRYPVYDGDLDTIVGIVTG